MTNLWSFILISLTLFSLSSKNSPLIHSFNEKKFEENNSLIQKSDCTNSEDILLKNKIKVTFCYKTTIEKKISFHQRYEQVKVLQEPYLFSKTYYNKNGKEILFIRFNPDKKVVFKEKSTYYNNNSIRRIKTLDSLKTIKTFKKDTLSYISPNRHSPVIWWVDQTYYDNNLLETCSDIREIRSHGPNTYDLYEFFYN